MIRLLGAAALVSVASAIAAPAGAQQTAAPSASAAPQDPVVGNWRGTVRSPGGGTSPIIITIVKRGDAYARAASP